MCASCHTGLVTYYTDDDDGDSDNDVEVYSDTTYSFSCTQAASSSQGHHTFYWYKNGTVIPTDAVTVTFTNDDDDFEGIYQCFVETSFGQVFQHTWRVFDYSELIY